MRTWRTVNRAFIANPFPKTRFPGRELFRFYRGFAVPLYRVLCGTDARVPVVRQTLGMPKQNFYAVRKGRVPGIYIEWQECETQVKGFPGPEYKKFSTAADAQAYMEGSSVSTAISPMSIRGEGSRAQKRNLASVSDESQWVVVYCDGACKGNGRPGSTAGIGVFWGLNDPRNIAERCPGDQTNNRAELIAIVRVLETVPMSKEKLLIKTDSQYSINCFEKWLLRWRSNDWKTSNGEFVKNAAIIEYISALLDERGRRGQQVRLQYVKGHSGHPGNNGADAQANLGATLAPRPDLEWKNLKARTSDLIESLIPTKLMAGSTLPGISTSDVVETHERPRKISKISADDLSIEPGRTKVKLPLQPHLSPPTVAAPPPRPARSPYRPMIISKLSVSEKSPTQSGQSSIPDHQATVALSKALPNVSHPTQTHPATESWISNSGATTKGKESSNAEANGKPTISSGIARSPLSVPKVTPPLIPVPLCDIDLESYKDCLLEGEDWAKEIADL